MDGGFKSKEEYEEAKRLIQERMREIFSDDELKEMRDEFKKQIPELAKSAARAMDNFKRSLQGEVDMALADIALISKDNPK